MRLVASAPVGAPLAMSTLGAGARSLRAPATPRPDLDPADDATVDKQIESEVRTIKAEFEAG